MAKKVVKVANDYLISALISIVVGALFCIFKGSILNWIMTVLGVLLIIYGIIDIYNHKTTNGIIEIVIGAVIIVCGWTIATIVLIVVGVLLIVWGIMNIKYISSKNIFTTVKVIAAIVLGILLVVQKFAAVDWLFIIIGVLAILNGIAILLSKK